MLLIRKARPLLWDQPSSGIRGESSCGVKKKERKSARRETGVEEGGKKPGGEDGAGGREGEASEGVVPGSTNQRQDAIDRHVAPGWCNGFHRGWKGGNSSCASLYGGGGGEIAVVAMAKKTEVVADREKERGKEATHPTWRRQRETGQGGRRTGVEEANARVLHTPLHLLVNRINQRHHGLSPHSSPPRIYLP